MQKNLHVPQAEAWSCQSRSLPQNLCPEVKSSQCHCYCTMGSLMEESQWTTIPPVGPTLWQPPYKHKLTLPYSISQTIYWCCYHNCSGTAIFRSKYQNQQVLPYALLVLEHCMVYILWCITVLDVSDVQTFYSLTDRLQAEKQQPTVNNHHQSMWTLLVIQNNELKENAVCGSCNSET